MPSEVNKLFGSNIRSHRIRCGMTQQEVGAALGYSSRNIGHIEHGRCIVTAEQIYALSKLFRVPVHMLFEYPNRPEMGVDDPKNTHTELSQLSERDQRLIQGLIEQMLDDQQNL